MGLSPLPSVLPLPLSPLPTTLLCIYYLWHHRGRGRFLDRERRKGKEKGGKKATWQAVGAPKEEREEARWVPPSPQKEKESGRASIQSAKKQSPISAEWDYETGGANK